MNIRETGNACVICIPVAKLGLGVFVPGHRSCTRFQTSFQEADVRRKRETETLFSFQLQFQFLSGELSLSARRDGDSR